MPKITRREVLLAVLLTLVLAATAVLVLAHGDASTGDPVQPLPSPSTTIAPHDPDVGAAVPDAGELLARRVVELLYAWRATPAGRDEVLSEVLQLAAETEINGLRADVARHLPGEDAWDQLADLDVRETLRIDTVAVPDSWADIVEAEDLPSELTAVTIEGMRIRHAIWLGEPVTSEAPVAVTVFLRCEADACQVLRLSEPGETLR